MIFNSKQLDELEQKHDGGVALEDSENKEQESGADAAMEWRVQLIEEGVENVKRSKSRPVDEKLTYEVNSLLFDRESRRFGRVQASVPGYLRIGYLTGGDREYGTLNASSYLRDHGATKPVPDLALQLGQTEEEVVEALVVLGIEPLNLEAEGADASAAPAGNGLAGMAKAEAGRSTVAAKKAPAAAKAKAKPEPKAAKKAGAKPDANAKPPSKSPIDNPNAFIKKNYVTMSNREMARETGLSEHTIRRKLGEWGLKRKPAQKAAKKKR